MAITWRSRSSPWNTVGECQKIIWTPTLSQFLAIGTRFAGGGATAATSPDSITWTAHNTALAPPTVGWSDVAWSEAHGIYLVIGGDGGLNVNNAFSSPDGVTWTGRGKPLGYMGAGSVIWIAELGLFVAAGGNNATWPSPIVATSPDGITWTTRVTPWDGTGGAGGGGGAVTTLAWNPVAGLIVAGGIRTSGGVDTFTTMTSPDGINWTSRTCLLDGFLQVIKWSPLFGKLLASGSGTGSKLFASSVDAINWVDITTGTTGGTARAVDDCFHELAVFGQRAGGGELHSADLSAWTQQLVAFIDTVCWSEDLGLAVIAGLGSGLTPTRAIYASVPSVGTGSGAGTCTSATLGPGGIIPNTADDDPVTWYFTYGPTVGMGFQTAGGTVSGLDNVLVSDVILGGLIPGTTYYFELVAIHGSDVSTGGIGSFVQAVCPDVPSLNTEFSL